MKTGNGDNYDVDYHSDYDDAMVIGGAGSANLALALGVAIVAVDGAAVVVDDGILDAATDDDVCYGN